MSVLRFLDNGIWKEIQTIKGEKGVGILNIVKTSTSELIDTYTITYTDGSTSTFQIHNGEKGDSPTKGIDYWTEEDKEEIIDDVIEEIEPSIIELDEKKQNITDNTLQTIDKTIVGAINELNTDANNLEQNKQNITDNNLTTNNKNIVSAINEVNSIANTNTSDIDSIEEKIPNQATSSNKLADKDFVNSSISTNTAHYIYKTVGAEKMPFDSVAELEAYTGTVTQNDYAFVTGTDSEGNTYFDRYKADVVESTVTWAKEYRLNNSSFTAEQWAAITSGITQALVGQIGTNRDNIATIMADYIKSTDYPTENEAGVIKLKSYWGVGNQSGSLIGVIKTFTQYNSTENQLIISKGTLENVIAGKELIECIKGTSAPTTSTACSKAGALYIDTTNNKTYQCTSISNGSYTWESIIRDTDYATASKGGVIRTSNAYGTGTYINGELTCLPKNYNEYQSSGNYMFIAKGTLENLKSTTIDSNSTDVGYATPGSVYRYIQSLDGSEVAY